MPSLPPSWRKPSTGNFLRHTSNFSPLLKVPLNTSTASNSPSIHEGMSSFCASDSFFSPSSEGNLKGSQESDADFDLPLDRRVGLGDGKNTYTSAGSSTNREINVPVVFESASAVMMTGEPRNVRGRSCHVASSSTYTRLPSPSVPTVY
jgi:hypothetical protein